jgi:hypothetical protein
MTATQEELDRLKQALEAEDQKLDELGKETDIVDRDLHPPPQPIDHPTDGGVI